MLLGDRVLRNPITGIPVCCPPAAIGQVAAPPSSVMNSRRLTQTLIYDDGNRLSDDFLHGLWGLLHRNSEVRSGFDWRRGSNSSGTRPPPTPPGHRST